MLVPPLASYPPDTASECWAVVIIPGWHERPQEIPSTKHLTSWNAGTVLVLKSLNLSYTELECHVTQRGMQVWCQVRGSRWKVCVAGHWWSDVAGGFKWRFGASSSDCSANPHLMGCRVWGYLCWGSRLSLYCVVSVWNIFVKLSLLLRVRSTPITLTTVQ